MLLLGCTLAAGGQELRLVDAVKAGNRDAVRTLLKQPAGTSDVNAGEVDGTTPLHWAVRANDVETVRLLLAAGARADVHNRYGVTPIWLAASNGSAVLVETLLKAGADANSSMPQGETVLMAAARAGNPAAVKALIASGADVNAKEDGLGENALMWAAAENRAEAAKILIAHGAPVDGRSKELTYEKDRFGLEGVLTILPRGNWTPLMYAARQGAVDSARVLAEAGADLNARDFEGTTALVRAIVNWHYDVAGVLLEQGADPNLADSSGMAALYAVVDMNTLGEIYGRPARKLTDRLDALELVKMLLEYGASPNATLTGATVQKNHTPGDGALAAGSTPLMRAAKGGDFRLIQALLDGGADPALTQRNRTTALMLASGLGRGTGAFQKDVGTEADLLAAVKLLVERGVDVNAVNDAGQTALHFAVQSGDSLVKYLAQKGATLDVKDRQGRTPLDVALGVGVRGRAGGPAPVRDSTVALLKGLTASASNGAAAPQ
ncbi:MAG: ankyrin repeat domain-containing protein [Acidobacteriota bacterium]